MSEPRARLVAGVLVALLVGFLPAHVVSAVREGSAYAPIRAELRVHYAAITDPVQHAAATEVRAAKLDLMRSRQSSIAITGFAIWVLCGVGVGWLWFRRIDWARYAAPASSPSGGSGP
jgi:hypothetical protein